MDRNIYCISGLGADERMFQHLQIKGAKLIALQWPLFDKKDSLPDYATKLCSQVAENNPTLLGVSFGGMLAVEMAKQLKAKQIFLISSVRSAQDFPFYYHLARVLSLASFVPSTFINTPTVLHQFVFGAVTRENKLLLREYLTKADPVYVRWALGAILNWKNTILPPNIIHIHGTKDHVIPIPVNADYKVQNAGHFMIVNKAKIVSEIISKELL